MSGAAGCYRQNTQFSLRVLIWRLGILRHFSSIGLIHPRLIPVAWISTLYGWEETLIDHLIKMWLLLTFSSSTLIKMTGKAHRVQYLPGRRPKIDQYHFGLKLKFWEVNGEQEILRENEATFNLWGNHENFYFKNREFGKIMEQIRKRYKQRENKGRIGFCTKPWPPCSSYLALFSLFYIVRGPNDKR